MNSKKQEEESERAFVREVLDKEKPPFPKRSLSWEEIIHNMAESHKRKEERKCGKK